MHTIKLNQDWLFTKENNEHYQSETIENGETVHLPHSFNAEDGQSGDDFYRGATWYQKNVTMIEKDLSGDVYLEINGASLQSEVYVNGKFVTANQTGFSMYRIHLTPYLDEGRNLLAVKVSNAKDDTVYPLGADFTFYGGLYRDVQLIKTDKQHFDLLESGRDGFFFDSQKADDSEAFIYSLSGKVVNPEGTSVSYFLKDSQGDVVVSNQMTLTEETFSFEGTVATPVLWDGIEHPYLYTVEIELVKDEAVLDRRSIKTGFRTVEVTPDRGVFLNGRAIKLDGISRHQDFADVGNAVTKEMMETDMALIKEIGANTVRLSHYQHDNYFYQLCDEAGLLVWTEIPFITIPTTSDLSNQNAKDQLTALIKQTRNHTSVFTYGIQNEITIAAENERTYRLVSELNQLAKELDPSRYTVQANIYSVADDSYLNGLTNIVGYNLYYGWYYGEMEDLGDRLDAFHLANPTAPVMVSEYGTDANPALHTYEPKTKDYTEEYQMIYHENALKTFNSRPFVLGGTVWNMFDFGSANRNEGGNKGKNQKGLVTIDRKIKKDAFYLYKAYWSKEPFVKIAGSRFVKRHRKNNELSILTNVATFDLIVGNNEPIRVEVAGPRTVVEVELGEGETTIKVIAASNAAIMDAATFEFVVEPEKSYIHIQEGKKKHVTNWFEKIDLSELDEVEINPNCYSTGDSIANLLRNQGAKTVIESFFGKMFESDRFTDMGEVATIDGVSKLSSLGIPKELLVAVNAKLNTIEKDDSYVVIE